MKLRLSDIVHIDIINASGDNAFILHAFNMPYPTCYYSHMKRGKEGRGITVWLGLAH